MGDAPFAVTHATWLRTESDRIEQIILAPRLWGRKWTHKRLQRELADIGLEYTIEQIAELNDELHQRLIVEDVKDEPVIATPLEMLTAVVTAIAAPE